MLANDPGALARQVLRSAVEAAVMAPSSHNSQPWRFRIAGTLLELLADPDRHLPVLDRERRQQVQSCGCALYNARIAVRAQGYVDHVTIMLVEDEHPELLATLQLGEPHVSTDLESELLHAIPLRRTNRRPFLPRPVASATTDPMIEAAAVEGATMIRLTPDQKHALGDLVDEADRLQYGDPAFRAELAQWLSPFGSRRKDGIPFVEKEYGSALPFTVMRALRGPGLGARFGKLEEDRIDHAPVVFVLGTAADDPAAWLACGQALEAVLLRATRVELSASFLNQVLELPELRARVQALVPGVGFPQMVIRLGFAEQGIAHAAPRRDVSDVLEIVPAIGEAPGR